MWQRSACGFLAPWKLERAHDAPACSLSCSQVLSRFSHISASIARYCTPVVRFASRVKDTGVDEGRERMDGKVSPAQTKATHMSCLLVSELSEF